MGDMRRPGSIATRVAALALAVGCAHRAAPGRAMSLRAACAPDARWTDRGCAPWTAAIADAVVANEARILDDPEAALRALDEVAAQGPFARSTYVRIWRQRGMAHSLLAHAAADAARDDGGADAAAAARRHTDLAMRAFDMLLALDPGHRLEYTQTPQTTFMFQDAIGAAAAQPAPTIDIDWDRDARVGTPVPVAVEVISDPKSFLARATLFVRRRGDRAWRATELALPPAGSYQRFVLPATEASAATALELYARAYDQRGNEVLAWASPERPRELPLRWDPPTRWYRTWWIWAIAGGAVAAGVGVTVYATQWRPSDTVGGGVVVTPR